MRTSTDRINWDDDAFYRYYDHGLLARMIMGHQQVQGINYAYTIQGWLKSINPDIRTDDGYTLRPDGSSGSIVSEPAYHTILNYFNGDYNPISSYRRMDSALNIVLGADYRPLFNGNISSMGVHIKSLSNPLLYNYQYDQLNRLTGSTAWHRTGAGWNDIAKIDDFQERLAYDPNGNILTNKRNGNNTFAAQPLGMDSLSYHYINGTNKLDHIRDAVTSGNYSNDLDDQSAANYTYDAIGNLIKDNAEGINRISWNVYGKIRSIEKNNGMTIAYTYDPSGNRISKTVSDGSSTNQTWYVRDAQGNVLSTYAKGIDSINNGDLTQNELHLYGRLRLGIYQRHTNVENLVVNTPVDIPLPEPGFNTTFIRGEKLFELSNHLGNVLSVVTDKKFGVSLDDSLVDHYVPDIVSAQDYYAFGSLQPGRSVSSGKYRYGYNGKENDNDVKGEGNQQDYGLRIYDSRVGRFLSVDPLMKEFPWNSVYAYSEGDPINFIDLDGTQQAGSPAQATVRPTVPQLGVPQLSNNRVNWDGSMTPGTQLFRSGPINSGAYAPQTRYVTQQELQAMIPPNAGAYINQDGKSMTVHGPNGSWTVSLLKTEGPKTEVTWVDRAIWRMQVEKVKQFSSFKQWNTSIQAYERITTDPSTLDAAYLQEVQQRLIAGKATNQDKIYEAELRSRKILYEINRKHDPTKPFGGKDASVLPSNHLELWNNRSYYDENTDTWWSVEGQGKKAVYHRFSGANNGAYHWSGSTGENKNRKGGKVAPIPPQVVPGEVKKGKNR